MKVNVRKKELPKKKKQKTVQKVPVHTKQITLQDFLKFAGVISTGGMAKQLIQDACVQVNGEMETRRGKKLQSGDVVIFEGRHYEVEFNAP